MPVTVKSVPLPCYHIKDYPSKFTYDDLKKIRTDVSNIKQNYYGYLRSTSNVSAKAFYGAVGINNIASYRVQNFIPMFTNFEFFTKITIQKFGFFTKISIFNPSFDFWIFAPKRLFFDKDETSIFGKLFSTLRQFT